MKRLPLIFPAVVMLAAIVGGSCNSGSSVGLYDEWAKENNQWYLEQLNRKDANGQPYYTLLQPDWYKSSGVLIRYLSDRDKTEGNLSPLETSQCKVKYIGRLYNDEAFDSSYTETDSARVFQPSGTIDGWQIALNAMRVGDSVEVVIPYMQGYGTSGSSSILPYSALRFNIKLLDIVDYETKL